MTPLVGCHRFAREVWSYKDQICFSRKGNLIHVVGVWQPYFRLHQSKSRREPFITSKEQSHHYEPTGSELLNVMEKTNQYPAEGSIYVRYFTFLKTFVRCWIQSQYVTRVLGNGCTNLQCNVSAFAQGVNAPLFAPWIIFWWKGRWKWARHSENTSDFHRLLEKTQCRR